MTDTTIVDPLNITNYNRDQCELETFWLFSILVAGKNSDTTSKTLSKFLRQLPPWQTPFQAIRELGEVGLYNMLVENRVGQYNRITKAIMGSLNLDLRTCTKEELMGVYGVSHKTSRFFLLHTRPFCDEIVLDTHILSWMKNKCGINDVPDNTPQNRKQYETIASICKGLMENRYPNMSLAQIDLLIWAEMSGRLKEAK